MKLCMQTIVIFIIYYIGVFIQHLLNLFIPGSVIGLILLFLLLSLKIIKREWIEVSARFFMKHLAIFFIPSTVGLIGYFYLFNGKGIVLIFVALISTIFVMFSSALISSWLTPKKDEAR